MSQLINRTPLDRFSRHPDVLRGLVRMYLDIAPKGIEEITAAVAKGDMEQMAFAAHSLKGSSVELGAEQLAELSQRLQMEAKTGDKELLEQLVKELSVCYRKTATALQALDVS